MKRKILYIIIFLSCIQIFVQCAFINAIVNEKYTENERGECSKCDNTAIIALFEDEPAYIREGCFNFFGKVDSFTIVLVNKSGETSMRGIHPCGGVPENFRVDSLLVLISGNILACGRSNACDPPRPNFRMLPINMFELKTIKMKNQ